MTEPRGGAARVFATGLTVVVVWYLAALAPTIVQLSQRAFVLIAPVAALAVMLVVVELSGLLGAGAGATSRTTG